MIIIIVLKLDSEVSPRQGLSYELGWLLIQVNMRMKVIIIIVLKLDLGVD
jgi:hypothetical protein